MCVFSDRYFGTAAVTGFTQDKLHDKTTAGDSTTDWVKTDQMLIFLTHQYLIEEGFIFPIARSNNHRNQFTDLTNLAVGRRRHIHFVFLKQSFRLFDHLVIQNSDYVAAFNNLFNTFANMSNFVINY